MIKRFKWLILSVNALLVLTSGVRADGMPYDDASNGNAISAMEAESDAMANSENMAADMRGSMKASKQAAESYSEQPSSKLANVDQSNMYEPRGIEQVDQEDRAIAIGHYAKARSLLIAAMREFDRGYNIAKPDVILNSEAWRANLVGRAEDLEKILAPQARVTRKGVKFEGDSRLLITEAKGE